jgi:hypothetical protein
VFASDLETSGLHLGERSVCWAASVPLRMCTFGNLNMYSYKAEVINDVCTTWERSLDICVSILFWHHASPRRWFFGQGVLCSWSNLGKFPESPVAVFWVVTPYSVVVEYQRLGGLWTPETLVFYHDTTRHHNPEDRDLNIHRHENL